MQLFSKDHTCAIVAEKNLSEAVLLAAQDLQRDLRRISGQPGGFAMVSSGQGIRIQTLVDGREEAYRIEITENDISITGSDVLGTVFGIYAFSTHFLKVVPVHRLVDLFPESRETMTLGSAVFLSKPRTVKFRGWFLNDEDLLCDFKRSGGHRHIDYPFYQNVMDVSVLDMILETALRLEINLVIPASFLNIDNPDEEALVAAVAGRGLYVSQHHVETVGVSGFCAEWYLQKHGITGEAYSFVSNRSRTEEIWRYYVSKWAAYGDRVIWQLGLRGAQDCTFWADDPTAPETMEGRGAVISDAIATQHRIIAETLGHSSFYSTSTLWMEGAELYGRGYITLPERTIVVFSDIGASQMFGDDFYQIQRRPGQHYGIYYHIGYWGNGAHLSEGTDLRKMAAMYRLAWGSRSLTYAIVNVSNVRPVHFSVWYNAQIMLDPAGFDEDRLIGHQLSALYGQDAGAVRPLLDEYYNAIGDYGAVNLKRYCDKHDFFWHEPEEAPYPIYSVTDGQLHVLGERYLNYGDTTYPANHSETAQMLKSSLARWETLYAKLEETEISPRARLYFDQFLKFPTFYMRNLTRWVLAVMDMVTAKKNPAMESACRRAEEAMEAILVQRKILEQGPWENWHRGDRKIDIPRLLNKTRLYCRTICQLRDQLSEL